MDYRLFEICHKYAITLEQLFFMLRIMSSKADAEFTWGRIFSLGKGKSKPTLSKVANDYQVMFNDSNLTDWEGIIAGLVDKELIYDYRTFKPSVIMLKDFEVRDEIVSLFFVNDAIKTYDLFVAEYTSKGANLTIEVNGGKYAVIDKHRDTLFALYERRVLQGRDKSRHLLSIEVIRAYLADNGGKPKYKISNFIENFDNYVEIYGGKASSSPVKKRHL